MKQIVVFLLICAFGLTGCFANKPVRHLSSDVCLIMPEINSKEDVLKTLGPPDHQRLDPEQGEIWYYFERNKSLFRKTPLIGNKLGYEEYDLVTVTFNGDVVGACVYRIFAEEEFKRSGIEVIEE